MRIRCDDCGGSGERCTPRLAVILGGLTLDEAMAEPDRLGVGMEETVCKDCEGRGWMPL